MRIRTLALLAALSGACAHAPPAPPADPVEVACARSVCLYLSFTGTAALAVRLELPPALAPKDSQRLELPFAAEPFRKAQGYGDFVRGADGRAWQDQYEHPARGLSLRYQVRLEHAQAEPQHGLDEVPHAVRGGWFLVGRAFIPSFKLDGRHTDPPVLLIVELGPGQRLATRAGQQKDLGSPTRIGRAGPLRALADAFYVIGSFHREQVKKGQSEIEIVSGDYAEHLPALARTVEQALSGLEAELGPMPPAQRILAYDSLPLGFAGGVVGTDISFMSSTPPSTRALSPDTSVLIHELTHLWSTADVPWLSEGFTDYFAFLVAAKLDRVPEQEALVALLRFYGNYTAGQREASIAEGDELWTYPAGMMVAFCTDATLRQSGSSLAAVYRRALLGGPLGGGVTLERFGAALEAVLPGARQSLDAMVNQRRGIDFERCLAGFGWSSSRVRYSGFPLRALVLDVLQITSFSPQRAEVFAVRSGSVFRPGDLILSVDGAPISVIPELDWLLREDRASAPAKLRVLRGGAEVELLLSVPAGVSREDHERLMIVGSKAATAPRWP